MDHLNPTKKAINDQKLVALRAQVDETKQIMVKNISDALERGDNMEELLTRTEDLEADTSRFKKVATVLRKKQWWNMCKSRMTLWLVGIGIIIVIILIIVLSSKPWNH